MKLIDKAAVVAEIEKRINFNGALNAHSRVDECNAILSILDSIEVKEVDLKKECRDYINCDNGHTIFEIAKHFFALGLSVNNPITAADRGMAEEIIINLKRVEQDYHINLTKEIEWLRNKVKKGE